MLQFHSSFSLPIHWQRKKRRRLSTALLNRIASQGYKFLLPSWQGFLCHCFMWCHMMPLTRSTSPKILWNMAWPCVFCCFYIKPRKSNKDQTACPLVGLRLPGCRLLSTPLQPELAWTAPSDSTWWKDREPVKQLTFFRHVYRILFVSSWMVGFFREKNMTSFRLYGVGFSMFLGNLSFANGSVLVESR